MTTTKGTQKQKIPINSGDFSKEALLHCIQDNHGISENSKNQNFFAAHALLWRGSGGEAEHKNPSRRIGKDSC